MGIDPDETLIAKVDQALPCNEIPTEANATRRENDQDAKQGVVIKNNIAAHIWNDYIT